MYDVLRSKIQNSSQKFHNNFINFEKPQNFQKNPKKLGQMHDMHEKEGLGSLPSEEKLNLGRRILEDDVWSERERERFWEVKRRRLSREIEEK